MRSDDLRPEGVGIYVEREQAALIAPNHAMQSFLSREFGGRIVDRDPKA